MASALACTAGFALVVTPGSARAFTYVDNTGGTSWGIQDAAPPGVDTGSIRATQLGEGQQAPYSTTLNGYGGIRVTVDTPNKDRFDGTLMRGFGLKYDGDGNYTSTQSVDLSGVLMTRSLDIEQDKDWGRWLDTFTNTNREPLTIEIAFGGETGYGASGTNASNIVMTSSGGAVATPADTWTTTASETAPGSTTGAPDATVVGSFDRTGDWLRNTFTTPMATTGHEANFPAYINKLTIQPGQSASLLHYVVVGQMVTPDTLQSQIDAVSSVAAQLAAKPVLTGLSRNEICSVVNFHLDPASAGVKPGNCSGRGATEVKQPKAPVAPAPTTTSTYNVVDKTIDQLQADMESGKTTSVQITQAYLDRIAAYDNGQFGFHAFITVASDAVEQARKADAERAAGRTGALLGIPIAVKDLYDTKDMPTTNGALTFAGFRPNDDSYQVAKLREAGAIIIGKANMEEYATSGNYSDSGFGAVWNAFDPSRSALASSGGSAVATATSMAAAALGSQTGDSLYAPASAASLVTLRGTDGMESDRGVMPLTWLQDYAGAIARSVPDLADVLNVVSGTDPGNPNTAGADAHRPADWRSVLDPNALRGKRIGIVPSLWADPFGTTTTTNAEDAALEYLSKAGAQIVEIPNDAVVPIRPAGSVSYEGWARYIDAHPELAKIGITSPSDVICSQKKLPFTRYTPQYCDGMTRMTPDQVTAYEAYRAQYKANIGAWMDKYDVDAVVYPGLLSDISLNDGGGNKASFGRRDTPSGSAGVPSVAFPAGTDANGAPINIQLLGRAWDDSKLVGMAYAFEQVAHGHVAPGTAPPLKVVRAKGAS